jgi:hypothetical protein
MQSHQNSEPNASPYALPGSAFVVLTGNINVGKTYQMTRLLEATDEAGSPIVAPILVITGESSGEGTAGDFYADPSRCLVWGATTCDDAFDILGKVFPEGRGPLTLGEARMEQWKSACELAKASKQTQPPAPAKTPRDAMLVRAVAVDSISTLYAGQMVKVGNDARAKGGAAKAMKSAEASAREQAKVAAPRCIALIDRLNGITQRHRGTLVVVACHVRKQVEQSTSAEGEMFRAVVGWAPDLGRPEEVRAGILATGYSALWQHLAAKANIIWHLFAEAPDFRQVPLAELNTREGMAPTYGAITMRGHFAKLGQVMWVKRQGGDGWLGFFDRLPPYWHKSAPWEHGDAYPTPDLGAVLSHCVAAWRERRQGAAA